MQFFKITFLILTTLAAASANAQVSPDAQKSSLGKTIQSQTAKDILGTPRQLLVPESKCTVVVFIGWECPLVRQYASRLNKLKTKFADQKVRWLAINSNQHDSLSELQQFAKKLKFEIPILKDVGNQIADQFAATRTPEAFLLNAKGQIVYQGRIDDQFTYGRQRPEVTTTFLADAIEDVLNDKPVATPFVAAEGCIIGRVIQASESKDQLAVTYGKQISRIMQKNCIGCHRDGEIGPFALDDYDEVVGWAGMIQEVVNDRRMPPWHADPKHGTFSNDCRLSETEIELINQWVDAGAPEGDQNQLPEPIQFVEGWQIGTPDKIVRMRKTPYKVPATGTVDYQYFEADPELTEDTWVCAAECRPGNRAVIHHIIVGIRGEGDFGRGDRHSQESDWLAASAPGSPPMVLPAGYAKLVPAGSKLIFQMHYTPNGVATKDISSVGLKFLDADKVTHRVLTLEAANTRFRIPPGEARHRVDSKFRFPRKAELISLFPHMHLRGKAFKYIAKYPDGGEEILLDVPHYDFNWQNGYQLATPKKIPKGTRIHCTALFDNSKNNIANPDPTKSVRWGDQTWEEMMIGYFNVAVPRK
jgi:peroxiredoxin/mono/diheme cytochrome c family protein